VPAAPLEFGCVRAERGEPTASRGDPRGRALCRGAYPGAGTSVPPPAPVCRPDPSAPRCVCAPPARRGTPRRGVPAPISYLCLMLPATGARQIGQGPFAGNLAAPSGAPVHKGRNSDQKTPDPSRHAHEAVHQVGGAGSAVQQLPRGKKPTSDAHRCESRPGNPGASLRDEEVPADQSEHDSTEEQRNQCLLHSDFDCGDLYASRLSLAPIAPQPWVLLPRTRLPD
jgi:hypothetical protein